MPQRVFCLTTVALEKGYLSKMVLIAYAVTFSQLHSGMNNIIQKCSRHAVKLQELGFKNSKNDLKRHCKVTGA